VDADEAVRQPTPASIAEAAVRIRRGELVAFPTETVYGLGADATSDAAVAAVFAAKNRPRFNPLIVHVLGLPAAETEVTFDDRARALAERFWPGPLTLVLARRPDSRLSLLVGAGLDTVAVRAPDHPVARALLAAAGVPIAAPSANASGAISPTTAGHVLDGLGDRVAMILDGGRCRVGIESTVVDLGGGQPALLRSGGIPAEAIEAVIGPLAGPEAGPTRSPGLLGRHYAPGRPVRLAATAARPGEALLGFGPHAPAGCLNLSPTGDLREAAANLFAALRALDRPDVAGIAVMPIPETGLGRAINDRLRRAAATEDDPFDFDRGPAMACVLPDADDA
jgi:L-threonylcarbamoyladenylate synthase